MRSSFSEENVNNFVNDLLIGKGQLSSLTRGIKINKVDLWDGKDAAPFEEESYDYDDDEETPSTHTEDL